MGRFDSTSSFCARSNRRCTRLRVRRCADRLLEHSQEMESRESSYIRERLQFNILRTMRLYICLRSTLCHVVICEKMLEQPRAAKSSASKEWHCGEQRSGMAKMAIANPQGARAPA